MDQVATNASNKKLPKDHLGLLNMMQQGATWDKALTTKFGASENADCEHCGACGTDIVHIVWQCPALATIRDTLCEQI